MEQLADRAAASVAFRVSRQKMAAPKNLQTTAVSAQPYPRPRGPRFLIEPKAGEFYLMTPKFRDSLPYLCRRMNRMQLPVMVCSYESADRRAE